MKRIVVDMKKDKYQGIPWASLSEYQKRKHENLLYLRNCKEGETYNIKFNYV